MLHSHEVCPICKKEFKNIKYLNKKCGIASGEVMSFLESICHNSTLDPKEDFPHSFFQVSSLYGQILFQSIDFIDLGRRVEINYISNSSNILFWPNPTSNGDLKTVHLENKILVFDFPYLEKIKEKTSTYALFL